MINEIDKEIFERHYPLYEMWKKHQFVKNYEKDVYSNLITLYTKYVSECSRQLTIPTPFPNIEIINRTCESITLENGRIIKNPNYMPDHKAPVWFCCFSETNCSELLANLISRSPSMCCAL